MMVMTLSPIEQIAQDIEDWGDGWRFVWNPDDHGWRARLIRKHEDSDDINIEIEIIQDGVQHFVYVQTSTKGKSFGWVNVSTSVRNPITRKALDHINRTLDEASEQATPPAAQGGESG